MIARLAELGQEYSAALREYCTDGGEAALLRAYQLGRRAVGDGLGVLEMAALHHEALLAALTDTPAPDGRARITRRASEFLGECLGPFELMRRGFQEALESTRGELVKQKRLEALKTEFISVISHEVRTPLTSIHGALNLLKNGLGGALDAQGQHLLDVSYRNSQRLVRFVNDLLDVERIESGTMTFNLRSIELRALLEQSIEASQAHASQLGIKLRLGEVARRAHVHVDADRLMQVMTNLLSNAAKFSPRGETVAVEATRQGTRLRVGVTDRGPGVPPQFRARIFERFAQAQPSGARGGSGLGLSITKAIVENMGGHVGFDSVRGRTTFYFELPECRPCPAGKRLEETWAAGPAQRDAQAD